ncbi:hypothetical protein SPB21_03495 [Leptothoe sp. ISB3NOV94-8A]
MEQVLIPRYPGAKSNRKKYPVWDGHTYDQAVVPFAGSGRWSIPALQQGHVKTLTVADADPAVRAVWEQFTYNTDNAWLEECIDSWVSEFKTIWHKCNAEVLAGRLFYRLCFIHDNPTAGHDSDGQSFDSYDYAASKILLHKLCFGGNVRSNSQGKLNISLRSDWKQSLENWGYQLPWCPPGRSVIIHKDWSECFQQSLTGKTIAFIDPPYYAPGNGPRIKGGMSKAYAIHGGNPNDAAVLELFMGAVKAAIDAGCDRVVATNYWGHMLVTVEYDSYGQSSVYPERWVEYEETTDFMRSMGFEWFHDLGPLQTMNNREFHISKAGTTEQRTVRHEGWWEMGGVRQHGRVDQLSLLEVAA